MSGYANQPTRGATNRRLMCVDETRSICSLSFRLALTNVSVNQPKRSRSTMGFPFTRPSAMPFADFDAALTLVAAFQPAVRMAPECTRSTFEWHGRCVARA